MLEPPSVVSVSVARELVLSVVEMLEPGRSVTLLLKLEKCPLS